MGRGQQARHGQKTRLADVGPTSRPGVGGAVGRISPLKEMSAHTSKKLQILGRYLGAYLKILGNAFPDKELLYVDACAGPGFYTGDDEGSPTIALQKIYECEAERTSPTRVILIEEDAESHALLVQEVDRFTEDEGARPGEVIIEPPVLAKCAPYLTKLLDDRAKTGKAI